MVIDRKRLIIEAATESFSVYGYKATTMDQVAKQANVGKGTIYTFFKNKEELFNEIITDLINSMKDVATEAMDPALSFKENVHHALYGMLEFRLKHQLTIMLFKEDRDVGTPVVQEMMSRMENEILSFIKDKVTLAIENEQIQPCDPKLTAFILVQLYVALIFEWEKKNEPLTKQEIAAIFDTYLIKGLSN